MISPLHQIGSVNAIEESKRAAKRVILAHDANANDICEILGLGEMKWK